MPCLIGVEDSQLPPETEAPRSTGQAVLPCHYLPWHMLKSTRHQRLWDAWPVLGCRSHQPQTYNAPTHTDEPTLLGIPDLIGGTRGLSPNSTPEFGTRRWQTDAHTTSQAPPHTQQGLLFRKTPQEKLSSCTIRCSSRPNSLAPSIPASLWCNILVQDATRTSGISWILKSWPWAVSLQKQFAKLNSSFLTAVVSSSFLFEFWHRKYYKNRGFGRPSFSAVFFSKKTFFKYTNFIECFRGCPREGDNFTSPFPSAPDLLLKASKAPFLALRVATASGAPRQAPLEISHRVLQGVAQRGSQFYFIVAVLRALFFMPEKMSLLYLKTSTPPEGNPPASSFLSLDIIWRVFHLSFVFWLQNADRRPSASNSLVNCWWKAKCGSLRDIVGAWLLGNENSARSFSDRSFFQPPWGHGRPRLRVMDVRTEMLVFPGFRGPDRSFCPRTSAGISAWTSAGYPAPKLTLWADFLFLMIMELIRFWFLGCRNYATAPEMNSLRGPSRQRYGTNHIQITCKNHGARE